MKNILKNNMKNTLRISLLFSALAATACGTDGSAAPDTNFETQSGAEEGDVANCLDADLVDGDICVNDDGTFSALGDSDCIGLETASEAESCFSDG